MTGPFLNMWKNTCLEICKTVEKQLMCITNPASAKEFQETPKYGQI